VVQIAAPAHTALRLGRRQLVAVQRRQADQTVGSGRKVRRTGFIARGPKTSQSVEQGEVVRPTGARFELQQDGCIGIRFARLHRRHCACGATVESVDCCDKIEHDLPTFLVNCRTFTMARGNC
jgi:hypothetical protein